MPKLSRHGACKDQKRETRQIPHRPFTIYDRAEEIPNDVFESDEKKALLAPRTAHPPSSNAYCYVIGCPEKEANKFGLFRGSLELTYVEKDNADSNGLEPTAKDLVVEDRLLRETVKKAASVWVTEPEHDIAKFNLQQLSLVVVQLLG